jgi:hypothetical protein
MHDEILTTAGNVLVPAYLALRQLGYEVRLEQGDDGRETWWATRHGLSLSADDPLALLGLHGLRQERGPDWKGTDDEIHAFLERFGHAAPD